MKVKIFTFTGIFQFTIVNKITIFHLSFPKRKQQK